MRAFFAALGVGVERVPGPLPDVAQLVQLAAERGLRRPRAAQAGQVLPEQGDRPGQGLVAEAVGALRQAGAEEGLEVLGPEGRVIAAAVVQQAGGVVAAGVAGDPVVDAGAAGPQQAGDLGDGPAGGRFQDRPGAAEDAGVLRAFQLMLQPAPLLGG